MMTRLFVFFYWVCYDLMYLVGSYYIDRSCRSFNIPLQLLVLGFVLDIWILLAVFSDLV